MDFDYLMLMSQLKFRDVIPWATPNIAKTYDHENLWLPKLKIMMIDHIVNVTQKNPKAKTHIWKLDNPSRTKQCHRPSSNLSLGPWSVQL